MCCGGRTSGDDQMTLLVAPLTGRVQVKYGRVDAPGQKQ